MRIVLRQDAFYYFCVILKIKDSERVIDFQFQRNHAGFPDDGNRFLSPFHSLDR